MTQNWDRSRVKSADILRPAAPQQPSVSVAISCALSTPRGTQPLPRTHRGLFSVGDSRERRMTISLHPYSPLPLPPLTLLTPLGQFSSLLVATHSSIPRVACILVRSSFSLLAWPLAANYVRAIISDRDDEAPGTAAAAASRRAMPRRATPRRATPRNGSSDGRVGLRPTRRVK